MSTARPSSLSVSIEFYVIINSMRAFRLVNQQRFIALENLSKNCEYPELLYKSNRPQVSMIYKLINHLGCWKNMRRIRKLRAAGDLFTNPSQCSSNIPSGLSAYRNFWSIA